MVEVSNIPVVMDLQHGKHYHDTLAGRVFSQTCTPLGLAPQVYTDTNLSDCMPLWNPANSNVNVELIRITMAKASGTSAFMAGFLMHRSHLGSDIATASEITAFAATAPFNGLLGGGQVSKVLSSNAGTCTMSAGTAAEAVRSLYGTGIAADATTNGINYFDMDFDGTILVPPGSMIWITATTAGVALMGMTVVWKEIPIRFG